MKKIAVFGICGKMGSTITKELIKENNFKVVCGLDITNIGKDFGELFLSKPEGLKICGNYNDVLKYNPEIIIDFTNGESAFNSILWAINNYINIIVGSTGISNEKLNYIEKLCKEKFNHEKFCKVFIVPNFSIGAVVMMKFSSLISKYFESCEIIEMHHDQKRDAPSGTAILTAEMISKQKKFKSDRLSKNEVETISSSRGAFYNGIHIHSIRTQGFLASQEVIFGTTGQTLKIRHDSIDRLSFYPGVLLAINNLDKLPFFSIGLDKLIDF